MRKYILIILIALCFVGCKANADITENTSKVKEPEKVSIYVVFSGDYLDMKIVYKDESLPVLKYTLTSDQSIKVYDSRVFTLKVRDKSYGDYKSFYIDDFTKDEYSWFIFNINGKYMLDRH